MKPLSEEQRCKAKERSRLYYLAHRDHCRKRAWERAWKSGRIMRPKPTTLARYGLEGLSDWECPGKKDGRESG